MHENVLLDYARKLKHIVLRSEKQFYKIRVNIDHMHYMRSTGKSHYDREESANCVMTDLINWGCEHLKP